MAKIPEPVPLGYTYPHTSGPNFVGMTDRHQFSAPIALLIERSGARYVRSHEAYTNSYYITLLSSDGRRVDIRSSDHLVSANPSNEQKARTATTLYVEGRGFKQSLAMWLGWSARQVERAKRAGGPGTQAWTKALIDYPPRSFPAR